MKKLHVEGMRFMNEDGHQVLMNGLCFICREKSMGYLEPGIADKLKYYSEHGFNLVRLGIFWDGVEPEPGVYDDIYLSEIHKVVEAANQHGMYVFLDMHQDLFSVKYIDGAPLWATLDEGLEHPQNCTMWYEAYVQSPAIIKTADNFWADKPAPDGIGVLTHYENMWEYIAGFFADCTNIIGLEPMNEPYMGSIAPQTFGMAIGAIMPTNPDFDLTKPETIRPEDVQMMQQIMTEEFMKFDKEILMPFYQRMLKAIRKFTDAALVTGGNIYSSSFVTTGIEKIDTAQIYAPHGYDAVVDSDRYDTYNKDNVAYLFSDKRASQERLNLPVIVGEWGCFPSGEFTKDLICFMNDILEKYLWSSTYHQYFAGMENDSNYDSLERAYPVEVDGDLISYHYCYDHKQINIRYKAVKDGTAVIYLPDLEMANRISASAATDSRLIKNQSSKGGYVCITSKVTDEIEVFIG